MADQQVPAPQEQETPAAAGPEGTGAAEQAEVDWRKRYSDLQPEYTRTTQRVREMEDRERWYELALTSEDADTRRQAVEALGYMLEEQEEASSETADYEDPYLALLDRQERIEQRLSERDRTEQEAQENALIGVASNERLAELCGDLDERSQNFILSYAINALPAQLDPSRRLPNGQPLPVPDIKGALEEFGLWESERQKGWAQSKRAPYVSPGGQTATEVPDLDSHSGRVDYAVRQLQQAEGQE